MKIRDPSPIDLSGEGWVRITRVTAGGFIVEAENVLPRAFTKADHDLITYIEKLLIDMDD